MEKVIDDNFSPLKSQTISSDVNDIGTTAACSMSSNHHRRVKTCDDDIVSKEKSSQSFTSPRQHRRIKSFDDRFQLDEDAEKSICSYDIPYLNSIDEDNSVFMIKWDLSSSDDSPRVKLTRTPLSQYHSSCEEDDDGCLREDKSCRSIDPIIIKVLQDQLAGTSIDISQDQLTESSMSEDSLDENKTRLKKDKCSNMLKRPKWLKRGKSDSIVERNLVQSNNIENMDKVLKRPQWLRRGKSDSIADKKQAQIDIEKRKSLIMRLKNDRERYLGGSGSIDSENPLHEETLSPQSSKKSADKSQLTVLVSPRSTKNINKSSNFEGVKISVQTKKKTLRIDTNEIKKSMEIDTDDESFLSSDSSIYSCLSAQCTPLTTPTRSIAKTPKFHVFQVDGSSKEFISTEFEDDKNENQIDHDDANDCESVFSFSSCRSASTASSVYTSPLSIRDPLAKRSKIVQRSRKLRQVTGDGDIWVEKVHVSKKSGKKRTIFVSVKTGIKVRDEPPSGASRVLYMEDLVHQTIGGDDQSGPEAIFLCSEVNRRQSM